MPYTTGMIETGGETQFRDLCHECFEALAAPEERKLVTAFRDARCQYCDPAFSRGFDFLGLATGVQQTRYMCRSCSQEFYRYVHHEVEKLSQDWPQQEQLEAMRTVTEMAEAHMRHWIEQRRKK